MRKNSTVILSILLLLTLSQGISYAQSVWATSYIGNINGNFLRRVQFINSLTGFSCGGNGTLIKTTNGGDNWSIMNTGLSSFLTCMYFVNANTGWVGSEDAVIKKTTNGGLSWISQPVAINIFASDFYFLNDQTGYLTSKDAKIFRTTNGGLDWNILYSSNLLYGQIQFLNIQTGWVLAPSYLAKTTNGGDTWNQIVFGGSVQDFKFINEQTGWMTLSNSIGKTTDGGASWSYTYIPITTPMVLKIFDSNVGWCAGYNESNGVICRTINGGANWVVQATEPNNKFYDLSFVNPNTGWASGNAIISSTTNGLVSVNQISSNIPSAFSLKQNYPNPFNPATKISFNIKNAAFVSLKVFDMTGKEVKSLVNENIAAGIYEVNFNAAELNSGVYFYTLKTNEFTETKKMMLVK